LTPSVKPPRAPARDIPAAERKAHRKTGIDAKIMPEMIARWDREKSGRAVLWRQRPHNCGMRAGLDPLSGRCRQWKAKIYHVNLLTMFCWIRIRITFLQKMSISVTFFVNNRPHLKLGPNELGEAKRYLLKMVRISIFRLDIRTIVL